jgi:alpha-L-fucosidase
VRPVPSWFRDAKFGVIVHWGLYSVPGWAPLDDEVVRILEAGADPPDGDEAGDPLARHSYAEWYQNSMLLDGPTRAHHAATYGGRDYGDFREEFARSVRDWSPEPWASLFASAGARYVVPVTKHHDGFRLWPSTVDNPRRSSWCVTRDVIGELGDAVRAHGMRYGLYYSGGPDWTFGHLPIRRLVDIPASIPSTPEYLRYVDAQWRELIDRYRPSILWNDIGYPPAADPERLIADYHAAVPDGVVNDRFGTPDPDVRTPEYARRADIDPDVWECVRAVGLSFGWNRQETTLLSVGELALLLADVVSKNGNLLLGVTPDDRGELPPAQRELLHGIGRWLDAHGEAIYGTRPWTRAEAVTADGQQVRFTCRGDRVYGVIPFANGDPVSWGRSLGFPDGAPIDRIGTDVFAVGADAADGA